MKELKDHNQEIDKLLADFAEQSPMGICIVQKRNIVYQNRAYCQLFGKCHSLLENKAISGIHPEDRNAVKNMVERIINGSFQSEETEFRVRLSDKGTDPDFKWVHCLMKSICHQGQDAIMINAVDITEAKEREDIKYLRDKMDFLNQIATGIAHEIRNPLTAIHNYLFVMNTNAQSILSDCHNLKSIKDLMPKIQIASDRIENVINRIMEFSKIEAPNMISIDINQILEKLIEFTANIIDQNGIQVEKSLAGNMPDLNADSMLIQQALLNILANAFNAMSESNGTKKIGIETLTRQNMICVNISDSGPGVSPETRQRIFEPFFSNRAEEVGIGLNIVQKIVALHQGFIEAAESKWGGLEMRIGLPIDRIPVEKNITDHQYF